MVTAGRISAEDLRAALDTADRWLAVNRDGVNAINVYPVPDGDTGTNMLLTWRAALRAADESPDGTVGGLLHALARGALFGARGNSGVILSQMLHGMAEALDGASVCDCGTLVGALSKASLAAYAAVSEPIEGTMLTVMREASAAGEAARLDHEEDLHRVLLTVVDEAHASVRRTPDLLPRLRDAGVVDAGGMGIAVLLQGMACGLAGTPLPAAPLVAGGEHVELSAVEHEGYGYCTEFVVLGRAIDRHALEAALLQASGESVMVVGEPDAVHVHVHLPDPGAALSAGVVFGSLAAVKVENMQAQHEAWTEAHEEADDAAAHAPSLGLVAVARGVGIQRAFRELGARVLDGGSTGKASAGELLEAARRAGRDHVFLLPNDKDVLMAAESAAREAPGFITVIPARSIASGLAAAVDYLPEGDAPAIAEAMLETASAVRSIEVSRATRDARVDGVEVRRGDAIALLDGRLVAARPTLEDALSAALGAAVETTGAEIATVYLGADAPEDGSERASAAIHALGTDFEVEVVHGGQPHFPYIVGIE